MTSKYCEVWVKIAQSLPLSVKAHRPTSSKQKSTSEKKASTFQIRDRTGMHSLSSRVSSQDHDKSSSPNSPEHLHCSTWCLAHFLKASHSESDPSFGRAHNLYGSIQSSQGLIHSTYTQCPKYPIHFSCMWSLLLLELPFNCPFRKENFCRWEIFMPVRFTLRLFLHSWNL